MPVPVPWTQRFDFYFRTYDDGLISVWLDMAARDHVPLAEFPFSVRIAAPMKKPRDDGLRSSEEFDALAELEEELVRLVSRDDLAVYWGRHVGEGRTDFYFHSSERALKQVWERAESVRGSSGYQLEFGSRPDPEWTDYSESLPDEYEAETMRNRDLQYQLERRGDRLEKPRVIDHVALFPSRADAASAAARLRTARFRTDRVRGPIESGRFVLEFHREDSCEDFRPDEFTAEVIDHIHPSGGEYDGWGCTVQS